MKLNHELLRDIMMYIESNGNGRPVYDVKILGYTENEIVYHFQKLIEANLINGEILGFQGNRLRFTSLTWNGHEYIENIKTDYIWNEIKRDIELKGLTNTSIDIIKDYANKLIRNKLGL